jgi:hypothetical protein
MAAQARVLRVTTGGESPVIITARACLAPPRLLAQALVRPAGALRYTGPTWSLDRSTAQVLPVKEGLGRDLYGSASVSDPQAGGVDGEACQQVG